MSWGEGRGWRLPLAPWGRGEVLAYGGGLTALAAALAPLSAWASLPPALLALFVAWFFRDPERRAPAGPALGVSPPDRRGNHVEELARADGLGGPAGQGHGLPSA